MTITWQDPGGSATGGTEFLATGGTGITAQTSVNNGQAYAYLIDTLNPAFTRAPRLRNAVLQAAGNRISAFFELPVLPATATDFRPLVALPTGGSNTGLLTVVIDNAGKIRLYTNAIATQLGATGSTVLVAGTWNRITLSYAIVTTSNWSAKVYVNGTLEMTRTNADGTLSSALPTDLGSSIGSGAGVNSQMYVSDIYVDDTTDQSDPGNVHVTAKLPTTNTTNGFDGTLGSGAVNERPVSTTNGRSHAATSDVSQDYEIQAAAVGDANLSAAVILGHTGWIWATLGSLTGTPSTNIIVNGAAIAGTWDPTTANVAQLFTTIVTSATYPQNANGKNIGSTSSVIAADTFLYDCGVVVSYIPGGSRQRTTTGVGT